MYRPAMAAIVLGVFAIGPAAAQQQREESALPTLIRLISADSSVKPVIGRPVSMGPTVIALVPQRQTDTIRIARATLLRIEERVDNAKSKSGTGLAIGAIVGGAAGAVGLTALASYIDESSTDHASVEAFGLGLLGGALVGGGIGALIGTAFRGGSWVALPTLSMPTGMARPRLGLNARISF